MYICIYIYIIYVYMYTYIYVYLCVFLCLQSAVLPEPRRAIEGNLSILASATLLAFGILLLAESAVVVILASGTPPLVESAVVVILVETSALRGLGVIIIVFGLGSLARNIRARSFLHQNQVRSPPADYEPIRPRTTSSHVGCLAVAVP